MGIFREAVLKEDWIIREDRLDKEKIGHHETIFTLGNGYIGLRGILEEGCSGGYPGTYIAGVMDRGKGESFEIVNVPNPVAIEIFVAGKRLSIDVMEIVAHRRVLDMEKGVLLRRTVFLDDDKRYEFESKRLFSLRDIHTGVFLFSFRSLDSDVDASVKYRIDGGTRNEVQAIGEPIRHYKVVDVVGLDNGVMYLEAETYDLGISIGEAAAFEMEDFAGKARIFERREWIEKEFSFRARKGKEYRFNILISIYTSRDTKKDVIKETCLKELSAAKRRGLSLILRRHLRLWKLMWYTSDIRIEGDLQVQKALRFCIYHLLIAASRQDLDTSVPAKALSGEWYKGHVFWDTEIYMLPFYVYTQPDIARNLLMYRCRRLEPARNGARTQGYKGALWPWESAQSGHDETPQMWVNFDGTPIPVYNSKREHHIAGDVIYGVALYLQMTEDTRFMLRCGSEMVFETARFWASRVIRNRKSGCYDIRDVIGPNEFQECVNNNSYTNALARWVLSFACKLYSRLQKEETPEVCEVIKRVGLEPKEIKAWRDIAEGIRFLLDHSSGLIEEFEGYFDKRDIIIEEWDESGMPVWPKNVRLAEVGETQLVKQADVVLLLHLFGDDFSPNVKRINLDYYEKRTTHKSSLSIPSYAIVACELGEVEKAYRLLLQVVNTDLCDTHGNTRLGIHAAALGGAWQIVVQGFAGVRPKADRLCVNPTLPESWKTLNLRVWFRGVLIQFVITRDGVESFILKGGEDAKLEIYGKRYHLRSREILKVASTRKDQLEKEVAKE